MHGDVAEDVLAGYLKSCTFHDQVHPSDPVAVTSMACGAEAEIIGALMDANKFVVATPGLSSQIPRILKKTNRALQLPFSSGATACHGRRLEYSGPR